MEKICPICGVGELKKHIVNEEFEYKGRTVSIPNYITYTCNECEESIVDNSTLKSSGRILKKFKREVDGLLSVIEIKRIRESLGFTQELLSDILGGGLKGFARYESGQITQSKAMDNLLRILDKYPFVLDAIWQKPAEEATRMTNILYLDEDKRTRYKTKQVSYVYKGRYNELEKLAV